MSGNRVPRSAAEAYAQKMGVSVGYARKYLQRFPDKADEIAEWDAELAAQARLAEVDALDSIDATDLEDCADDDDPKALLDEIVSDRAERILRGRLAAHASWANTEDRTARTRPGREAFEARFERQVDPDGVLDPVERRRRAEHAMRAHMLSLSYKSAKARRLRKEGRG